MTYFPKLVIAPLLACLASSVASADTISVYTWSGYLDESVVAEFEADTGHEIQQMFFDRKAVRDRSLLSEQQSSYDLVLFDSVSLRAYGDNGLLTPLSPESVSGLQNHRAQDLKACQNWGVPFANSTLGIAYRSSFTEAPITSWESLFTPPKGLSRYVVMPLDNVETSSIIFLALGEDLKTKDPDVLESALTVLDQQLPHLLRYGNPRTYAEINGRNSDMRMTMAYSSDVRMIKSLTGQDDWKFVIPKEGTISWQGCWAVPQNRPNKQTESMIDFLSYLNQPEIAARNAEHQWIASTNQAAKKYLSDAYTEDLTLNLTSDMAAKVQTSPELDYETLGLRNLLIIWARYQHSQYKDAKDSGD